MRKLTTEDIDIFLKEYQEGYSKGIPKESIKESINKKITAHLEKKAVLGFDIYRYSQYPALEQTLIPHLFKVLYNLTILNCIMHESFIFQTEDKESFTNYFIDAGDGGFQIFHTPFHAVVFAIYFQANIKRYNSGTSFTATLRKVIGEITLRYSLTYDATYSYGINYYGPSIINNARIMAKDKLNRFLIDENTVDWFTEELNGIENMQIITLEEDFKNIKIFKNNTKKENKHEHSVLFDTTRTKILKVDLLKIGEIKSKLDTLSIHSLHIQTLMHSSDVGSFKKYTISLGNLNSSGITE